MKKNQIIATIITAVMTITAATTTAMTAFAGSATGVTGEYQEYNLKGMDPNMAETKPTVSLSRIELPLNVAQENPVQEVEMTITGAKLKYCSTGFHIGYDERLTVVLDEFGSCANMGPAGKKLGKKDALGSNNDLFISTMCSENLGIDGVLWTFQFQLPENLEVGDKFPIEVLYRNVNGTGDIFASLENDDASHLMEAWVFTNGIEQGYIEITEPEIEEIPEEEPEKEIIIGDINGDQIINASDASQILATYSLVQVGGDIPLTEAQIAAADINKDGKVDAKDASDALRYYTYLSIGGTLTIEEFLAQ